MWRRAGWLRGLFFGGQDRKIRFLLNRYYVRPAHAALQREQAEATKELRAATVALAASQRATDAFHEEALASGTPVGGSEGREEISVGLR